MTKKTVPNRVRQCYALAHAKSYLVKHNNPMFRIWIERAMKFHPISEHQWHNLKILAGHERVEEIKNEVEYGS